MPRATTKTELITAANDQWDKMWKLIDAIPGGAQAVVFNFDNDPKLKEAHWQRDKNLRDVYTHLYEWHQLLLKWTAANLGGEAKPFLLEPYNWKTYGDMNVEFWKKHQSTAFEDAITMLYDSHAKVMALIETFNDDELFEKKHFSWTSTSTLGSYCVSVTASHYDWAMKKIKQLTQANARNRQL
jgi:hypothetical protein